MIFKTKYAKFFLLIALLTAKSACADLSSRITTLEKQMDQISTKTAEGNVGGKTASALPQISGHDWFISADLLWWHANEGGADYAALFENPYFGPSQKVSNHRIHFDWDFGFRVGIGKSFHHDNWDLCANFTRFLTQESAQTSLHHGAFVIPLLGPIYGLTANKASNVKVHWNLKFYNLDLNLGRHFFLSRNVAIHPFAGLKTAWIAQNVHSKANLFAPVDDQLNSKTKNDFWGIGPMLGGDGKWFFGNHFNVFGSLAGSLLWGDFDVHQKQRLKDAEQTTFSVKFDRDLVVPAVQMQIGIGYETNLRCNRSHLGIHLCYEGQYWWQQNQMPYFPEPTTYKYKIFSEDLSLEGITLDVRFDF